MATKLIPLNNLILVRRLEPEGSKGAIFIPTAAQELPNEGIVEAIGPRVKADSGVRIGNKVLFGKYSGSTVERDGEKLLLLQETEVLCVVETEKEAVH